MNFYRAFALCTAIAFSGAANATTITFDALPGTNGSAYSSYTESGYTVDNTVGDAFVAKGYGNPVPGIFFGSYYGSAGIELVLTSASGTFTFGGFDYTGNNGDASYSVKGFLGAAERFTFAGSEGFGFAAQVYSGSAVIDRLVFTLNAAGSSANLDNIVVNAAVLPVPEPASWAMMIGGLVIVGSAMRRRKTAISFA